MKNTQSITDLREKIDKIDNTIFDLLSKRFTIVQQLFNLKKEKGISITDSKREQKLMNKITLKHSKIKPDFIQKIYALIFNYSKKGISTKTKDKN